MKLYLEKRGCDFMGSDVDAAKQSDLENYRLFLEFIDKAGKRICGDVSRGAVRSKDRAGRQVIVSQNGLYTDFQYENHSGCYCYESAGCVGRYTKANVLSYVNRLSAVVYDDIEIVDNLPDAAHEYPEYVLELEKSYLLKEHAALVRETELSIRDRCSYWMNGLQWSFSKMTADEYKYCTLIAFRVMSNNYGVVEHEPARGTIASITVRRMVRHFFEVQHFVDPYADEMFLKELESLSPYYVRYYISKKAVEKS